MGIDLDQVIQRAANFFSGHGGMCNIPPDIYKYGNDFHVDYQDVGSVEHADLKQALALALDKSIDVLELSLAEEL